MNVLNPNKIRKFANMFMQLISMSRRAEKMHAEISDILSMDLGLKPKTYMKSVVQINTDEKSVARFTESGACEEDSSTKFNKIVLSAYTYYQFEFYNGDNLSTTIKIDVVRNFLHLACTLDDRDMEMLIKSAQSTADNYAKTLEKIKQIVAIIKMILGVEEQ
jgi:hypothetical protein